VQRDGIRDYLGRLARRRPLAVFGQEERDARGQQAALKVGI
jgi:hypothetical protein